MIAISSHINPMLEKLCHAKCVPLPILLNTGVPLKTRWKMYFFFFGRKCLIHNRRNSIPALLSIVSSVDCFAAMIRPYTGTGLWSAREKFRQENHHFHNSEHEEQQQQQRTRNCCSDSILVGRRFVAELIYLLFEEMWLLFISYFVWCPPCFVAWFLLHARQSCTVRGTRTHTTQSLHPFFVPNIYLTFLFVSCFWNKFKSMRREYAPPPRSMWQCSNKRIFILSPAWTVL